MRVPSNLAKLGCALELRVEKDGHRFSHVFGRGKVWLCTDEGMRTLYLVPAPGSKPRKLSTAPDEKALKGVTRAYKRWSEFEAGEFCTAVVKLPPAVTPLGRGASIAYASDKWSGRTADYEHVFEGRPQVRRAGSLYVISGGGISVTPSGIRG